MNASETNYKESRQSHAVVFVPHHLGSVKGSSPDVNPLIYLFILDIVSQTSSHNQEEIDRCQDKIKFCEGLPYIPKYSHLVLGWQDLSSRSIACKQSVETNKQLYNVES